MAEERISLAEFVDAYQERLAECQQYKHQVGRLEREAQQWVSHCLIVEAASQRTAVQLEKAIADLARQRAQTKDGKQQLESQVAALKEELKIKDSANEAAQAKISRLKAENVQLLEDLETQSGKQQKAFSDLATEVDVAKKAEQQMKGHVVAIYKELKLKHIAYEAAQANLLRLEAENAQLQADLQTQRFNIDKHQKDLMRQETTNAELASLVTQLQQKSEEDKHALEELAIIKADRSMLKIDNLRRLLDLGAHSYKAVEDDKDLVHLKSMNAELTSLVTKLQQQIKEDKVALEELARLKADTSQLKSDNLRRLFDIGAQSTKMAEYEKLVAQQKAELAACQVELKAMAYCKMELCTMRTQVVNLHKHKDQLQAHNTQLPRDLAALTVKTDVIALRDKLNKFEKLNEYLKAKQQQMYSSNQQLQEMVAQLERQLQQDTSTMLQQTTLSDDVVATAQAALKPVAVGSSNAGRESGPTEPSTPELGDDSCKSS